MIPLTPAENSIQPDRVNTTILKSQTSISFLRDHGLLMPVSANRQFNSAYSGEPCPRADSADGTLAASRGAMAEEGYLDGGDGEETVIACIPDIESEEPGAMAATIGPRLTELSTFSPALGSCICWVH